MTKFSCSSSRLVLLDNQELAEDTCGVLVEKRGSNSKGVEEVGEDGGLNSNIAATPPLKMPEALGGCLLKDLCWLVCLVPPFLSQALLVLKHCFACCNTLSKPLRVQRDTSPVVKPLYRNAHPSTIARPHLQLVSLIKAVTDNMDLPFS